MLNFVKICIIILAVIVVKKNNPLEKFYINTKSLILLIVIVLMNIVIYTYSQYEYSKMNIVVSSTLELSEKESAVKKYERWKTVSEVSLIFLSVSGSALVSALLIEKKNNNKIIEDFFVNDFYTSNKFFNYIDRNKKEKILFELENELYFDGSKEKANMYHAIKEKINKPIFKPELMYSSYFLDINCEVNDHYIEKKIVRKTSLKALTKPKNQKGFLILSVAVNDVDGYEPIIITKLQIDGEDKSLSYIEKKESINDNAMGRKKGYNKKVKFYYNNYLNFSNRKDVSILLEYTTRCPLKDLTYSCRMQYPCKKFTFNFAMLSQDYLIAPYAFGFIDDAKDTPNHTDDQKKVNINFDNWIYPLDGVCVFIEKNVANL